MIEYEFCIQNRTVPLLDSLILQHQQKQKPFFIEIQRPSQYDWIDDNLIPRKINGTQTNQATIVYNLSEENIEVNQILKDGVDNQIQLLGINGRKRKTSMRNIQSNKISDIKRKVKNWSFITFMKSKLEEFDALINKIQLHKLSKKFMQSNRKKSKRYLLLFFIMLHAHGKAEAFLKWFNTKGLSDIRENCPLEIQQFYQCFEEEIKKFIEVLTSYLNHQNLDQLCTQAYNLYQHQGKPSYGKIMKEKQNCLKQLMIYCKGFHKNPFTSTVCLQSQTIL